MSDGAVPTILLSYDYKFKRSRAFYRSHGSMRLCRDCPYDATQSASRSLELALPRDEVGGVCNDGLKVASGL